MIAAAGLLLLDVYSNSLFDFNRDVHVIELDNGQPDSKNKNNNVHIHLAAGGSDDEMSQPRDVALVLKSSRPVRWIVSSAPVLSGSLLILAENQNQVDISSLSARQQSDVRSDQSLPSAFEILIVSVTADWNPPVSYVKVPSSTNSVEIIIGKKQQQQLRLLSSSKNMIFAQFRQPWGRPSSNQFLLQYLVSIRPPPFPSVSHPRPTSIGSIRLKTAVSRPSLWTDKS